MTRARFESFISKAANRFGLDLRRHRPSRALAPLCTMLAYHHTDLVLDVGANVGQFAMALRTEGYRGRIVSFEPLSSAHAQLLASSRHDPEWQIADRQAIGNVEGRVQLRISGNSVSSSTVSMLSAHIAAAPDSAYVGHEIVELTTLDNVAPLYLGNSSGIFVKIDTQGTEDKVLDGGRQILERAHGLQLELSLLPLYDNQQLFDQLDGKVREMGFQRWAISPVFSDGQSGRMLQVDGVYFRA